MNFHISLPPPHTHIRMCSLLTCTHRPPWGYMMSMATYGSGLRIISMDSRDFQQPSCMMIFLRLVLMADIPSSWWEEYFKILESEGVNLIIIYGTDGVKFFVRYWGSKGLNFNSCMYCVMCFRNSLIYAHTLSLFFPHYGSTIEINATRATHDIKLF